MPITCSSSRDSSDTAATAHSSKDSAVQLPLPYTIASPRLCCVLIESRYGLSGSVWSSDEDKAAEMANQLQVGQIFTNSHGGRLDVPFGGFKQSGIGRVFGQVRKK